MPIETLFLEFRKNTKSNMKVIKKRNGKYRDAATDCNWAYSRHARRMTSRQLLYENGAKYCLPDLTRGLDACIQITTKCRVNSWTRSLRRWADKLVKYCAGGLSLSEKMKRAKSYFTLLRCCAIRDNGKRAKWPEGSPGLPPVPKSFGTVETRRLLHQFSRVSRSLREADTETVNKALEDHKLLLSTPFVTSPAIRARFRRFIRFRFGGDTKAKITGVDLSSSFARARSKGGACTEVKDLTDEFRNKRVSLLELEEMVSSLPEFLLELFPRLIINRAGMRDMLIVRGCNKTGLLPKYPINLMVFPYDKETEMSLEDWEQRREVLISIWASFCAINQDQLPKCRQVAVKERGWKVRVATPLEAPFRYLLSMINVALLSLLESCPQVTSALHGIPAEMLDWTSGARYSKVFSADLKTATDRFPHDLMNDAAHELSINWPAGMRALMLRAVGPHMMECTDGSLIETERGILMGSPVSWPLLSIYSAFLHSESGSDGWYAVCGDDYIGCHTDSSYRRYKAIRDATGALGSPGKDILTNTSVGVFAEELITVGRGRWLPTVSIRAVLADPKSGLSAWQQGPEVTEALNKLPLTDTIKGQLCRQLHEVTIIRLEKAGIDPFAPRWCGGAGFPGIPTQTTLRRARGMISQAQSDVVKWITQYELAWSTSSTSTSLMDAVMQDIAYHADFNIDYKRQGEWGPLKDIVSLRLGSLSWGFFLSGAVMRQGTVKMAGVVRAISRCSRDIMSRIYWVKPDEKILCGEGINCALQELEPCGRPIPFRSVLTNICLRGPAYEPFLIRKRRTGPGTPEWGRRKRARLGN